MDRKRCKPLQRVCVCGKRIKNPRPGQTVHSVACVAARLNEINGQEQPAPESLVRLYAAFEGDPPAPIFVPW